ncbi:MAG TPA: Abi-alpha family protein [Candidatus Angelobacter sp.]|jgi:hypothetical protein
MGDEDKLVKAGVEAALKPFADLLDKLAGPAAEEIGLTLKDHVRVFRMKRQVRLCQRVKDICADAHIEPQKVPIKVLLPLLDAAAIEETDELQDIWANMLANAAAGGNKGSGVEPVFPLILKELGIQEVKFLDELYEEAMRKRVKLRAELPSFINVGYPQFNIFDLRNVYLKATSPSQTMDANQQQQFRLSFDIVMRNRLLDELYDLVNNNDEQRQEVGSMYRLSSLGARFIQACRTPKAGEPELDGSENVF